MDIPLAPQHLRSLLDFIGHSHGVKLEASDAEMTSAVDRFRTWNDVPPHTSVVQDYARYAAFVAKEVSNGSLIPGEHPLTRLKIALDLLLHVILEGNLQQRNYEFDFDVRRIADVLISPRATADDVFGILVRRSATVGKSCLFVDSTERGAIQ